MAYFRSLTRYAEVGKARNYTPLPQEDSVPYARNWRETYFPREQRPPVYSPSIDSQERFSNRNVNSLYYGNPGLDGNDRHSISNFHTRYRPLPILLNKCLSVNRTYLTPTTLSHTDTQTSRSGKLPNSKSRSVDTIANIATTSTRLGNSFSTGSCDNGISNAKGIANANIKRRPGILKNSSKSEELRKRKTVRFQLNDQGESLDKKSPSSVISPKSFSDFNHLPREDRRIKNSSAQYLPSPYRKLQHPSFLSSSRSKPVTCDALERRLLLEKIERNICAIRKELAAKVRI